MKKSIDFTASSSPDNFCGEEDARIEDVNPVFAGVMDTYSCHQRSITYFIASLPVCLLFRHKFVYC